MFLKIAHFVEDCFRVALIRGNYLNSNPFILMELNYFESENWETTKN